MGWRSACAILVLLIAGLFFWLGTSVVHHGLVRGRAEGRTRLQVKPSDSSFEVSAWNELTSRFEVAIARLEAIAASLDQLTASNSQVRSSKAGHAAGDLELPPLDAAPDPIVKNVQLVQSAIAAERHDLTAQYFCWGRHAVYEQMGVPDRTSVESGTVAWQYADADEKFCVEFCFVDGIVIGTRVIPWTR